MTLPPPHPARSARRPARAMAAVAAAALVVLAVPACSSGGSSGSAASSTTAAAEAPAPPSLVDAVDPFIGTDEAGVADPVPGGHGGDVFPGATVPFGAVQWSPDTPGAENPSGYAHADDTIADFSLTHFSGAGCPNSGMFRMLPTTGGDGSQPAAFDHADESASPGSYRVRLADGIDVQLAATTRGGMGRFAFPAGSTPTLVIDGHSATPFDDDQEVAPTVVDDHTIEGREVFGNFCGSRVGYPTYLRAEFDTPFVAEPGRKPTITALRFPDAPGGVVTMRLALSPVSTAGAAANLAAEVPGGDVGEVAGQATAAWHDVMDRMAVTGGSDDQRTVFATALYHSLLHPNVFSDVDGRYPGFDGTLHQLADGHVHYANVSGWDIYRSQVQLLAVLAPDVAADLQATLLDDAQRCGGGFDQWSFGNVEGHVMLGDPGAVIVANLDAFGIDGADPAGVLDVMERSALDPATTCGEPVLRPRLDQYLDLGHTPGDVSRTLEYGLADAAIAAYARRHDAAALADRLADSATSWRNLWNADSGYLQPRDPDGSWGPWRGPAETVGYTEGNAAQYTWMVPQDYGGLVDALGGDAAATARLDDLFAEVNAGVSEPHFYIGNEPQFTVPFAYAWTGHPAGTQEVVPRIVDEAFGTGPGGLPGNDDLGATSSWLVWAQLGMFPVVPGQDVLVLTTPAFPKVVITAPGRQPITVTAPGAPKERYVAAALLNGKALDRAWIRYGDLGGGGELAVTTSAEATDWATTGRRPPSIG